MKDIFTVLNNPKFFTSYKQYNGGYIAALFDNDHKKEAKDLAVEAMKNILTDKIMIELLHCKNNILKK